MKPLAAAVGVLVALDVLAVEPAHAQDASFGCKILLCLAASSPSWEGIPYCVPPVHELLNILKHGGSWPSCPEGNASAISYQPYEDCPSGSTAVEYPNYGLSGGNGRISSGITTMIIPDENGAWCASPAQAGTTGWGYGSAYTFTARPLRDKPYYVDIMPSGLPASRFWFSLN